MSLRCGCVHASALEREGNGGATCGGSCTAAGCTAGRSDCTAASAKRTGAPVLLCKSVCTSMICTWHAQSECRLRVGGTGRRAAAGGGRMLLQLPHPPTSASLWLQLATVTAMVVGTQTAEERASTFSVT